MAGEGYPDIEQLLADWLKTQTGITQVHVGDIPDDVPPNLPQAVPVIMIARFGGPDGVLGFDNPSVDIDVFASTRNAAKNIAEKVRREMRLNLPRLVLSGATITRVGTASAPISAPWDSGPVRRFTAAYTLGVHHPI